MGFVRVEATLRLERFAFGGVVRYEEVFDLVDEVLVQVVERPHVVMVAGVGGDGEQSVVALGFGFLGLLGIKAADEPRRDEAADEGWLVHQDQHVDGVTVVGFSRGHGTEVVREKRACGQHAAQLVQPMLLVPLELVPATLGRIDDDMERIGVVLVKWGQAEGVGCHGYLRVPITLCRVFFVFYSSFHSISLP